MSDYVEVMVKLKLAPVDEDEVSYQMQKTGKSMNSIASNVASEVVFDALYNFYENGPNETEFAIEDIIVQGPSGRRHAL